VASRAERTERRVRVTLSLTSVLTGSVIALGLLGCDDASDSTSTTAAERSTTTQAQSPPPDAADFLGATLTTATAGEPGVVVQSVQPDSKSSLKPGDVIVALNGASVASADQLIHAVGTPKVGSQFKIEVVRGKQRFPLIEVQSPMAYLGAKVRDATGDAKGALVVAIAPNGPAAAAKLQPDDLITAIDGTPVRNVDDLFQSLGAHAPGDEAKISVARGARRLELTATLTDRPAPTK
jgi:S1-C subfamily serine protease